MVSTRGVKFKFTEGERVLCYEPDPTKAKVLYESKVLELVVKRDKSGRKVPEYLVHFQGWNSSWDRCVGEDFVLQDTTQNRTLQRKLAYKAALHLKGKKRKKLPAIFKDTFLKKRCLESPNNSDDSEDATESSNDEDESSNDDDEATEEEEDAEAEESESSRPSSKLSRSPFTTLELSTLLKEKLEDDCFLVTARNKLVQLPCQPNVLAILEGYVKQLSFGLLCATPQAKESDGKRRAVPPEIEEKINLNKELVDGLRIFFDFSLPLSLLYQEERKQFENIESLIIPEVISPTPAKLNINSTTCKEEIEELSKEVNQELLPWHSFHPVSPTPTSVQLNLSPCWNKPPQFPIPVSPSLNSPDVNKTPVSKLRQSLSRISKNHTPVETSSPGNSPGSSGVSNVATIRTRTWARSQSLLKGNRSPNNLTDENLSTRRVTRSLTDRTRNNHHNNVVVESHKIELPLSSSTVPVQSPDSTTVVCSVTEQWLPESSNSPPHTPLKTNHNTQCTKSWPLTPVRTHCSNSQSGNSPPPPTPTVPPPFNLNSISSVSSSASSTHSDSTLLTRHTENIPSPLRDSSGVLNEILSWQLLPPALCRKKPVPPSVVYGAQHLLRLFVKLPDYLERMNIPRHKRGPLVDNLGHFIKYIEEKCDELLPNAAYKDVKEFDSFTASTIT